MSTALCARRAQAGHGTRTRTSSAEAVSVTRAGRAVEADVAERLFSAEGLAGELGGGRPCAPCMVSCPCLRKGDRCVFTL